MHDNKFVPKLIFALQIEVLRKESQALNDIT